MEWLKAFVTGIVVATSFAVLPVSASTPSVGSNAPVVTNQDEVAYRAYYHNRPYRQAHFYGGGYPYYQTRTVYYNAYPVYPYGYGYRDYPYGYGYGYGPYQSGGFAFRISL